MKITADIIDYANTFQSLYDTLVESAKNISDKTARNTLVDGLKVLEKNIQEKQESVDGVQKDMLSFNNDLTADYRIFQSDANTAEAKLTGDNEGIAALQKELDAIHSAMNKDIGLMAGGAVAVVGGVALMVVGIAAEIPTAGVSTALVGGGMVLLAGGVLLETLGASDYTTQVGLLKGVAEMKSKEETELTGLTHAKTQLMGFTTALSAAIQSVSTLRAGWLSLGSTLGEVIQKIENVDPTISGAIIVAQLNTANKDWAAALELAKTLQPNGQVPAKTVKDLEGTFKSLKKPNTKF